MHLGSLHRWIDRVAAFGPFAALLKRRYEARFPTMNHAFHGVFESFEAALAEAPSDRCHGYDNEDSARKYVGSRDIGDHDYPALHWLQDWTLSRGGPRIADLGGNIGGTYHAFKSALRLAPEATWLVVDVPAVVELGRSLAQEEGLTQRLRFTTEFEEASGCDVLLAFGSLQYLPVTLGELLSRLESLPGRIVVNATPVHPERSFFTLNSIGTAVCPYRVVARDELLEQVCALGYELRDSWRNRGKSLDLPFSPELSLRHYSGFCFDLVDRPA